MPSVSITIDEKSSYTINLEDTYRSEDFIETFEKQIKIVRKISGLPEPAKTETDDVKDQFPDANESFKKLSSMIETLGNDIRKEDGATMRSYKLNRPLRSKILVMLSPKGQSLVVYLRKGNHSSLDPENRINEKPGFGGYPMIYIRKPDEVDYVFDIIQKIYQSI